MSQKAAQKQRSHEAILDSARALLRSRGIRASSVMDVMKGAGLTVGGFYSHFESKEHLFAETIRNGANATWKRLIDGAKGESARERIGSVMERYLSKAHRDHPEAGCILPSAAPEVAREGEPYRSALEHQLQGFILSLTELGDGKRETAIALIALMAGALSLSRAVAGTKLSDEILKAARTMGEQLIAKASRAG